MITSLIGYIRFKVVRAIFALALLACVIAWLDKMFNLQGKTGTSDAYVASTQQFSEASSSHKSSFAEQEAQRESNLAIAERNEKDITKANARTKKEMSNECQFWKLQQKMGKSSVANVKVNQYCAVNTKILKSKL